MNYQKQAVPAYSGITINITNPTLNATPPEAKHTHECHSQCLHQQPNYTVESVYTNPYNNELLASGTNNENITKNRQYNTSHFNTPVITNPQAVAPKAAENAQIQPQYVVNNEPANTQNIQPTGVQQTYPPQYYLNNYNYMQNGEKAGDQAHSTDHPVLNNQTHPNQNPQENTQVITEENMSSSQNIIENLDAQVAEQKNLEKNGKKTRVVMLTNEYIMSLENYLNNPNSEIRLMASKEILKRLDEDKDRFDDAALNALLNKMLQDPNKLVRIAALSAFSSQLASGNDYTVTLLKNIQANPNADKDDVLQAADILLKMSSTTEIKYVPVKKQEKSNNNKELEVTQKQNEQLRAQLQKYKEKEIEQILKVQQGK